MSSSTTVRLQLSTLVLVGTLLVLGLVTGLYVHNIIRIDATHHQKQEARITAEVIGQLIQDTCATAASNDDRRGGKVRASAAAGGDKAATKTLCDAAQVRSLLERLDVFRTASSDRMYCFVMDKDGKMVVNGGRPGLGRSPATGSRPNMDVSHLHVEGEEARNVFDVIRNAAVSGGGFCHYRWPCPDTGRVRRKTSYVTLLPQTGWIVGCGFYDDAS